VEELTKARRALNRGAPTDALRLCESLRSANRETATSVALHAQTLQALNRREEADALLEDSHPRFSWDWTVSRLWARSAEDCGKGMVAIERWRRLAKDFSSKEVWADMGLARCLMQAGRYAEADDTLSALTHRFPGFVYGALEWARAADRGGDHEEVLLRLNVVNNRFPRSAPALMGVARILCRLNRFDEAEALLGERRLACGLVPGPAIEHARLAERRKDWAEAQRRWAWVHATFPSNEAACVGLVTVFCEQGKFDAAEALLSPAIDKSPKNARLFIEYAMVAHRQGRWGDARQRWAEVRTRFPNREEGFRLGAVALTRLGNRAEAEKLRAELRRRFRQNSIAGAATPGASSQTPSDPA
jgi:predicted Zn-dependent protease